MASQLIVLGNICKLPNVYYSAAHGKFLVQSTASYYAKFDYLGFLSQFFLKILRSSGTQGFNPNLCGERSAAKSMRHAGRKLVDEHQPELYAFS